MLPLYVVVSVFRDGGGDEETNKVVVEISAMVLNTTEVVGTDYWLGVSVEVDESAIWAAQVVFTPIEPDEMDNMASIHGLIPTS